MKGHKPSGVFLPGRAGNVGESYERAVLYAMSSRFEGFPNTLALDRLTGDAALRVQFAARAVEARERFSVQRIAGMWKKLFAEVR